MGNQRQTLIPSKLKYITLTFHKTNNNKLEPTIGFNASIYDNAIECLFLAKK